MDYVFYFQTVTFPTTHLLDRSFFSYLSQVPTMVSSDVSSSISQFILFTVCGFWKLSDATTTGSRRLYNDFSKIRHTHCHINL